MSGGHGTDDGRGTAAGAATRTATDDGHAGTTPADGGPANATATATDGGHADAAGTRGGRRSDGAREVRPEELRSHQWYGTDGLRSFSHRARTRQLGYLPEEHLGKPVIAILNTWSDINPCHVHLRDRAQAVKRGVWQAGGFPLEFPVSTLSETFQKPTPMLYRNLLAMETEELLRSYPVDGAVLMGGCDKTTPALLMGAASVDLPTVFVPAGPMLPGHWRGETLGSGTDMWKYWDERRAGTIGDCELAELESGLARSPGHCMTMGTASTLTAAAETLGVTVPGASSVPAVDSGHDRMAAASGLRIVELVRQDLRLSRLLTREAYEDAVAAVLALGGSTNAVIHLIAMAGRSGVKLTLDDFDRIARTVPVLANLRPGGKHLMEDFHFAGGMRGFLSRITDVLHLDRPTVSHATLREQLDGALVHDDDVIRERHRPLAAEGGLAVLRGNLCPDGAVIKHVAMEQRFLKHTGPAVVFDDYRTMQRTIDDPALGITADHVLVLRGAGPKGGPGMPEYGMLPIPKYLLEQGVRDMVRISDARMSGTSYGACVLHVAPESHVGGPLALVRTGDTITLDVAARSLHLHVADEELERRGAAWTPPPARYERGYGALYMEQISQADTGCDFEFLARPGTTPDPYAG
ncbi:L-arabinonate dehydratase [Streptomyces sp. KL110A]|uniref:L-arabinonate dehydratase n=1 Tax=Streptomyces sp. KL110A TaxID=3384221 RepID=UPI0038CA480F